jgi:hypothetical protein
MNIICIFGFYLNKYLNYANIRFTTPSHLGGSRSPESPHPGPTDAEEEGHRGIPLSAPHHSVQGGNRVDPPYQLLCDCDGRDGIREVNAIAPVCDG